MFCLRERGTSSKLNVEGILRRDATRAATMRADSDVVALGPRWQVLEARIDAERGSLGEGETLG